MSLLELLQTKISTEIRSCFLVWGIQHVEKFTSKCEKEEIELVAYSVRES